MVSFLEGGGGAGPNVDGALSGIFEREGLEKNEEPGRDEDPDGTAEAVDDGEDAGGEVEVCWAGFPNDRFANTLVGSEDPLAPLELDGSVDFLVGNPNPDNSGGVLARVTFLGSSDKGTDTIPGAVGVGAANVCGVWDFGGEGEGEGEPAFFSDTGFDWAWPCVPLTLLSKSL